MELNFENPPIIFIHYGNSSYLNYVISCAQLYNPHKQIILLGDHLNHHYSRNGVIHFYFKDYMVTPLTIEFQNTFYIINEEHFWMKGKDDYYINGKPGHFWQRFNWLRYFILYEFWKAHNFEALWTFDSDNMIVMNLSQLEPLLEFDYCELHSRSSMQGLLKNKKALGDFCRSMISIFSNQLFLDDFKEQLKGKPAGYTFTEMTAFKDFQRSSSYRFLNGCQPFYGFVFDAVISREQGFELKVYNTQTIGQTKRVFFQNGNFYFQLKGNNGLIQTANLDCSWVPNRVLRKILRTAKRKNNNQELVEITFEETFTDRIQRFFYHYFKKLKNNLPLYLFIEKKLMF